MTDGTEPASSWDCLLRAEHVTRIYADGAVAALVDVSLEVPRGQYLAIVGPSGSGKSTLLNLLGALDLPTSGKILFEGRSLADTRNLAQLRAGKIGFVFQSFNLLPTLTAQENVQIPMFESFLSARERTRKSHELLEAVGIAHRAGHLPSHMSVGERQRTAIARALANDPPLLLADEPTGNLDSQSGHGVLDLFDRLHQEQGRTLVVITHSDEVAARAERVVTIRDGRILPSDGRMPSSDGRVRPAGA
jgi:putative ABC transport system ATP-binding protein